MLYISFSYPFDYRTHSVKVAHRFGDTYTIALPNTHSQVQSTYTFPQANRGRLASRPHINYYLNIMKQSTKQADRPLTPKQREFVKELVTNPKATKVSAYKKAYNVAPNTKIESVYRQAIDTSQKPQVVSALINYNELVEKTLTNTVQQWSDSEKLGERSLAVDTAKYIHDKIHGKATQRIEQQTTGVTLTIDLTSALAASEDVTP